MIIVGTSFSNIITTPLYWTSTDTSGWTGPFPLNRGSYTDVVLQGINDKGIIVGNGNDGSNIIPLYWVPTGPATWSGPFPLNSGSYTSVFAKGINETGIIVGYDLDVNNTIPLYWVPTGPATWSGPFPLNLGSYANVIVEGINDKGIIVCSDNIGMSADPSRALYWMPTGPSTWAEPVALDSLDNVNTYAYGINSNTEAISNICFPAGTPITTDQGLINIEHLDKLQHTIASQPITHITQTRTLDKYLISFEKNSIARNVPTQQTVMSKDHKIEFDGKLVPAYRFLDYSREVKKIKYNGEVLYNVLLQQHSLMNVNGLICETLHPENIIAKLYTNNYLDEERNTIIFELNDSLIKRDLPKYKALLENTFRKYF